MRGLVLALAAALANGCGAAEPPPSTPAPVLALVELGSDASTSEPPPGAPLVFTPSAVRCGEGPPLLALERGRFLEADVRGGEHGYLVEALTPSVATTDGAPLALAFDPSIPYQTVARAIYTAGQAGTVNILFLVRNGERVAALPIVLPHISTGDPSSQALADVLVGGAVGPVVDAPAPAPLALGLALAIEPAGIVVRGSGGRLAPGCETMDTGPAPTVPARAGAPDLEALRACLRRVKRAFPEETNVIVLAAPAIPFEQLARVIGAARGTATETLFPDVSLGIPAL